MRGLTLLVLLGLACMAFTVQANMSFGRRLLVRLLKARR
jgi:hypothetical protein